MLKPYLYPGILEAGCDEAGRGCLCGPVSCAAVILPPDFECPELNDSKQLTEKKRAELRPYIEEKALAWAVVMVDAEEIDRINILNASIIGMHRALDRLTLRPQHILVDGNRFKPYTSPIAGYRETPNPSGHFASPESSKTPEHFASSESSKTPGNNDSPNRHEHLEIPKSSTSSELSETSKSSKIIASTEAETFTEGIIIPHTTVVKGDATYMSIAAASVLAKTHRDELMDNLAKQYPGYSWEVNKGYPTKAHRAAIATLGVTPLHRKTFRLL